jgi:hypothetical protein
METWASSLIIATGTFCLLAYIAAYGLYFSMVTKRQGPMFYYRTWNGVFSCLYVISMMIFFNLPPAWRFNSTACRVIVPAKYFLYVIGRLMLLLYFIARFQMLGKRLFTHKQRVRVKIFFIFAFCNAVVWAASGFGLSPFIRADDGTCDFYATRLHQNLNIVALTLYLSLLTALTYAFHNSVMVWVEQPLVQRRILLRRVNKLFKIAFVVSLVSESLWAAVHDALFRGMSFRQMQVWGPLCDVAIMLETTICAICLLADSAKLYAWIRQYVCCCCPRFVAKPNKQDHEYAEPLITSVQTVTSIAC